MAKKYNSKSIKSFGYYVRIFSEMYDDATFKQMTLEIVKIKNIKDKELRKKKIEVINNHIREYRENHPDVTKRIAKKLKPEENDKRWKTWVKVEDNGRKGYAFDPAFYRSKKWRELRKTVLGLLEHKCMRCEIVPENISKLHVDHVIPRCKNVKLELDITNMQLLCEDCNRIKGTDKFDYRTNEQIEILKQYKYDQANSPKVEAPTEIIAPKVHLRKQTTSSEEVSPEKEKRVFYNLNPLMNTYRCYIKDESGLMKWDNEVLTKEQVIEKYEDYIIENIRTMEKKPHNKIYLNRNID